jgi:hypothetical protein
MKTPKISLLLFLASLTINAQKPEIGGYVSEMPSALYVSMFGQAEWYWENLVHNRLNFSWQMNDYWRFDAGVRNRFLIGSDYLVQPTETSFDKGWIDASWNILSGGGTTASGNISAVGGTTTGSSIAASGEASGSGGNKRGASYLLNTAFDRFYITYEKDSWRLQLGRQRINWGQTFVWNPNDLFNVYSFFDFDYPERPGADAFRATFYNSETASTELAAALNHYGKATAALMHHRTWHNTDIQALAGVFEASDIVVGGALTSDFNGLNLRAEASLFKPYNKDSTLTVAVSAGADYVFSNSLMLQAEALYNNVRQTGNLMNMLSASTLSPKSLSVSEWNIFAQATYPITPRLNAALSAMYFVDIKSIYSGLSMDYSIKENLDLSAIIQYFSALNATETMQACIGYLRLKYSF